MRSIALAFVSVLAVSAPTLAQDEKKEAPRDASAALGATLAEKKVNLSLEETPIADAVEILHDLTDVPIVWTKAAQSVADNDRPAITLSEKDLSAKAALEKIVARAKLAYEVWHGVVFILAKGEAEKKDHPTVKLEGEVQKKLEKQKLTFNFADTPLAEVMQFLSDFTGVKVTATDKVDAEVKVSLRLKGVAAADALAVLARLTGLAIAQSKDALVVSPRAEQKPDAKGDK